MPPPSFITAPDGLRIAYRLQPGAGPTVVFLPGFNSDMAGSKAEHLAAYCAGRGQGFLRLDYTGHGLSDGTVVEGSIGRWCADALSVIDAVAGPRFVLVGSSMGGWIALLAAIARPGGVAGLLGIAAAPDFTDRIVKLLPPAQRAALFAEGQIGLPSDYGPPLRIGLGMIEEGGKHALLGGPIPIAAPVRLLHGQADPDVPWQDALRVAAAITGSDVRVMLVKDGGHRLSRPGDLAAMQALLAELLGGEDGA